MFQSAFGNVDAHWLDARFVIARGIAFEPGEQASRAMPDASRPSASRWQDGERLSLRHLHLAMCCPLGCQARQLRRGPWHGALHAAASHPPSAQKKEKKEKGEKEKKEKKEKKEEKDKEKKEKKEKKASWIARRPWEPWGPQAGVAASVWLAAVAAGEGSGSGRGWPAEAFQGEVLSGGVLVCTCTGKAALAAPQVPHHGSWPIDAPVLLRARLMTHLSPCRPKVIPKKEEDYMAAISSMLGDPSSDEDGESYFGGRRGGGKQEEGSLTVEMSAKEKAKLRRKELEAQGAMEAAKKAAVMESDEMVFDVSYEQPQMRRVPACQRRATSCTALRLGLALGAESSLAI